MLKRNRFVTALNENVTTVQQKRHYFDNLCLHVIGTPN